MNAEEEGIRGDPRETERQHIEDYFAHATIVTTEPEQIIIMCNIDQSVATAQLPEKTVKATLHDSQGPLRRRLLWPMISAAWFVAAFPLGVHFHSSRLFVCAAIVGAFVAALARVLLPRASPRLATLRCRTGAVRIRGAGLLNDTLRAKDVVGATTARFGERFVLSLALGRRVHPLQLELDSLDDVKIVCEALGVGHHGYGAVSFDLEVRAIDVAETTARVLFAALLLALSIFVVGDITDDWVTFPFLLALVSTVLVALLWGLRSYKRPTLVLRGDAMHVGEETRWKGIHYESVSAIETTPTHIVLRSAVDTHAIPAKPVWWLRDGMSARERELLVAQIDTAVRRAHGKSAFKDDSSQALAPLRRGSMSVAQWLVHLDGIAATANGGAGYRGGITFGTDELRRTFEDPDAEPELRAAAGRVLSKLSPAEARLRVGPVLETIRDESVRKRIAILLDDDAERAEREIDEHERRHLDRAVRRL